VTIPLQAGIVYGPVKSRRLGASLGINILPDARKICNFNCPYCQYGWTPSDPPGLAIPDESWPHPAAIAAAVDAALEGGAVVDRITLAGNGEPTMHPHFPDVVERLRTVRDRRARHARLAVLSNASTIADPAIAAALRRVDERYMKLDAGDPATLRALNGTGVPIGEIVEGLARLNDVVLQAMFTRDASGKIDNTTEEAVSAWLAAVRRIRPNAVHIYSIDREPAWMALQKVPTAELHQIAARVKQAGIPAIVF
jgi:wyosine [tRNA(Phe)-imidazoG37] synthetase (radical SAM superfamily)